MVSYTTTRLFTKPDRERSSQPGLRAWKETGMMKSGVSLLAVMLVEMHWKAFGRLADDDGFHARFHGWQPAGVIVAMASNYLLKAINSPTMAVLSG